VNSRITLYLLRHGETSWSKKGKHTGLSDIALTQVGINQAKYLGKRLAPLKFDHVFSSPLKRASQTCQLCHLLDQAEITKSLLEWNYGDYEGKTSSEIQKIDPDWTIFSKGAPNGESILDIEKRVDQFLNQLNQLQGTIALFSSGHISRALAIRFLGLPIENGSHLKLETASLSILDYEHNKPAIDVWNDTSHLRSTIS
jgi:broad specificity phosphatase PhoE